MFLWHLSVLSDSLVHFSRATLKSWEWPGDSVIDSCI